MKRCKLELKELRAVRVVKEPRDSFVGPGSVAARKFKGGLVDQYSLLYLPSGWNLKITTISKDPRTHLPLGPDGTKYGPVSGKA